MNISLLFFSVVDLERTSQSLRKFNPYLPGNDSTTMAHSCMWQT